ncbi:hypothetical protein GCM10012275_62790 [Longimycelium tulufanense]|uniref:Uncharacterized protein n=1 Tax=Longimycelium tulufanense TaxID=907463 RepID=A0A8J3CLJ9_9PSEU|nr:hypothetical protein GCM10012275_62790 [Longimycelium tulufanense]
MLPQSLATEARERVGPGLVGGVPGAVNVCGEPAGVSVEQRDVVAACAGLLDACPEGIIADLPGVALVGGLLVAQQVRGEDVLWFR